MAQWKLPSESTTNCTVNSVSGETSNSKYDIFSKLKGLEFHATQLIHVTLSTYFKCWKLQQYNPLVPDILLNAFVKFPRLVGHTVATYPQLTKKNVTKHGDRVDEQRCTPRSNQTYQTVFPVTMSFAVSACGRSFVRQFLTLPPQIRWRRRRRRQNLRLIPGLARNFNGIFIGLSLKTKPREREGIIILISSVRLSVPSSLSHGEFELH